MRVRWLTSVAGHHSSFMRGQVTILPALTDEAKTWLERGWVEVLPDTDRDTATVSPTETATVGRKARRRPA